MPEEVAAVLPVMVISELEPAPMQEPDLQEVQPLPVAVAMLDVTKKCCFVDVFTELSVYRRVLE